LDAQKNARIGGWETKVGPGKRGAWDKENVGKGVAYRGVEHCYQNCRPRRKN